MRAWTAAGVALCLAACNREVEVPSAFEIAHGPGPVERIECRMGECYWRQRQSVTVLERVGDGVRIKVVGRSGNSTHMAVLHGEAEFPSEWSEAVAVKWRPETTYLRCSHTHPETLMERGGEFILDKLALRDLSGVQQAAANGYMLACHSLGPGKWSEKTLTELGYSGALKGDQSRYATLQDALDAMAAD